MFSIGQSKQSNDTSATVIVENKGKQELDGEVLFRDSESAEVKVDKINFKPRVKSQILINQSFETKTNQSKKQFIKDLMIGDTAITKSHASNSLYYVPIYYDTIKEVNNKWQTLNLRKSIEPVSASTLTQTNWYKHSPHRSLN